MEKLIQILSGFCFMLASKASSLRKYGVHLVATVEAEYGDDCVEGAICTLAHHGPRRGNPPPCNARLADSVLSALLQAVAAGNFLVGLSHVDLDTLGGCMRLAGYTVRKGLEEAFWAAAGQVDIGGVHHLNRILRELEVGNTLDSIAFGGAPTRMLSVEEQGRVSAALHAWWAWSEANKQYAPRDGAAEDITAYVLKAVRVLGSIFAGDADLLTAGEDFRKAGEKLNVESFDYAFEASPAFGRALMVVRRSDSFCNHLYVLPDGRVAAVVIALNPERGSITVSKADEMVPLDCKEFVQSLWGKEAGGHSGIAGSPRDAKFGVKELNEAVAKLVKS